MNLNVNRTQDFEDVKKSPMRLIGEISRLMGEKMREKGEENPISQKSGRDIMFHLARRDGRTQLDLVKATHLKAPTVSVSLQRLEKEGFVTRKTDEYDMRATRVFLTEKGRDLDNKIRKRIRAEEDLAMSSLTESEKDTLCRLLEKIKVNIISNSMKDGELI
ncbi:MAG: MarR family transcriptional regulator [Ruminococcaceae bacterium]|nr:MarR family transcriptional regulator [Oscillospiraceae bacterium]